MSAYSTAGTTETICEERKGTKVPTSRWVDLVASERGVLCSDVQRAEVASQAVAVLLCRWCGKTTRGDGTVATPGTVGGRSLSRRRTQGVQEGEPSGQR